MNSNAGIPGFDGGDYDDADIGNDFDDDFDNWDDEFESQDDHQTDSVASKSGTFSPEGNPSFTDETLARFGSDATRFSYTPEAHEPAPEEQAVTPEQWREAFADANSAIDAKESSREQVIEEAYAAASELMGGRVRRVRVIDSDEAEIQLSVNDERTITVDRPKPFVFTREAEEDEEYDEEEYDEEE